VCVCVCVCVHARVCMPIYKKKVIQTAEIVPIEGNFAPARRPNLQTAGPRFVDVLLEHIHSLESTTQMNSRECHGTAAYLKHANLNIFLFLPGVNLHPRPVLCALACTPCTGPPSYLYTLHYTTLLSAYPALSNPLICIPCAIPPSYLYTLHYTTLLSAYPALHHPLICIPCTFQPSYLHTLQQHFFFLFFPREPTRLPSTAAALEASSFPSSSGRSSSSS
jgi:hypothetical protein